MRVSALLVSTLCLLAAPRQGLAAAAETAQSSTASAPELELGRHRLLLGGGISPSVLLLGNGSLHGWVATGVAGYGFQAMRGLEFGAEFRLNAGQKSVILPMIYVRPFLPLAQDRTEIGLHARLGTMVIPDVYSKLGASAGLGVDVREWISEGVGVQLSADAIGARGPDLPVRYADDGPQVVFGALEANCTLVLRL